MGLRRAMLAAGCSWCVSLAGCAEPFSNGAPPVEPRPVLVVAVPDAPPENAPRAEASSRPKMDLVFALDTTGSMSGMIDGAKAKIWEIARRAQEGKPAPELRVGLVAYRDIGDEYITKVVPLTSDLDVVYANLTDFRAAGGGDGPEHVLKGLDDAVNRMPWAHDPDAIKLVYLVGDAPPHFDYQDGITLERVLGRAKQQGIRISAIRCGDDGDTLAAFTKIALPTDGDVATIEQSGGVVVAAATPYDEKLARLNAELAATEIHYGSDAERAEAAKVVARNLSAPVVTQAERAAFYSARSIGAVKAPTKKDLVAVSPAALAGLRAEDLPDAMRKMTPEERSRFVEEQRKRREAILAKVRAAKAERDEFVAKSPPKPAPARALDYTVMDSMKKAASGKVSY